MAEPPPITSVIEKCNRCRRLNYQHCANDKKVHTSEWCQLYGRCESSPPRLFKCHKGHCLKQRLFYVQSSYTYTVCWKSFSVWQINMLTSDTYVDVWVNFPRGQLQWYTKHLVSSRHVTDSHLSFADACLNLNTTFCKFWNTQQLNAPLTLLGGTEQVGRSWF